MPLYLKKINETLFAISFIAILQI